MITPEQLQELIAEVEQEDPIDFADIPYDEQELRALVANHLCEMATAMEAFSEEERHLCLLAVAAKLVLENLVLHVQLLREHPLPPEHNVQILLDQLRRKK
ncbi:MAG: hypothetical protein HYZ45_07290 [Burkholderiales bacterium]|nr:hypothetical protein [Burkholderiales bacterium]